MIYSYSNFNMGDFDDLLNEEIPRQFLDVVVSVAEYTGVSSSAFYKCKFKGQEFIVKMAPFIKQQPELYGSPSDYSGTINTVETEIKILKIFRKEFIQSGATPCFIELVHNIIRPLPSPVPIPDKSDDVAKYSRFNRTIEEYSFYSENGLSDKKVAFLVLEQCDCTLDSFFNISPVMPFERPVRTAMIFMIIHAFAVVTSKYPSFRHSDLHLNNILLKADPKYKERIQIPGAHFIFGFGGKKYYIPYYGIFPKVIDFSYASLPEKNIVSIITRDKYVTAFRRDSDITFMLQNIIRHDTFYNDFLERVRAAKNIASLLEDKLFSDFSAPIKSGTKIKSYNI